MSDGIMTFRGKYAFLSNMYATDFEWDGRTYHSSEAAFQSAKSLDPEQRKRFSEMSGLIAKREGKRVKLRSDWESVKDAIMEEIVYAKFSQNPELAKCLIDTGDMMLVEGNRWHDTYWGVDITTGKGENHLGEILMKVRAELGGTDYLMKVAAMRAERERALAQERMELETQIAQTRAQLDAFEPFNFVGKAFDTRAFGKVTIIRQEGNMIFFEARGSEKKFMLPGCVIEGYIKPDENLRAEYKRMKELQENLKELEKKLRALK